MAALRQMSEADLEALGLPARAPRGPGRPLLFSRYRPMRRDRRRACSPRADGAAEEDSGDVGVAGGDPVHGPLSAGSFAQSSARRARAAAAVYSLGGLPLELLPGGRRGVRVDVPTLKTRGAAWPKCPVHEPVCGSRETRAAFASDPTRASYRATDGPGHRQARPARPTAGWCRSLRAAPAPPRALHNPTHAGASGAGGLRGLGLCTLVRLTRGPAAAEQERSPPWRATPASPCTSSWQPPRWRRRTQPPAPPPAAGRSSATPAPL